MPLSDDRQQEKRRSYRRWLAPITLSLIVNLFMLGYAGDWFGRQDFVHGVHIGSFRYHVYLPDDHKKRKIATLPQPRIKPTPERHDLRPREPLSRSHRPAVTARAGARRAPTPVPNLPKIAPRSAAPRTQEPNVANDPFQPDVAPAAIIPQPAHAQHTVSLPTPPTPRPPTPKPAQIASVSGTAASRATKPFPTPTPDLTPAAHPSTGLAAAPGAPRVGSGGQGQADRGSGSGAGGVLPFGVGGGRGGEGDHHIVYLLDFSPSMVSRLRDLRIELDRSLSNLTPDDLFDIFAFGDHVVKMEDYLEPATPDAIKEAHQFMSTMNQINGTNIEEVLIEALNLHHVNEIVLITDGVPEDGETDFDALEHEIRLANIHRIRIDTIGLVGINDYNNAHVTFQAAQLLHALARESGGDYKLVQLGYD